VSNPYVDEYCDHRSRCICKGCKLQQPPKHEEDDVAYSDAHLCSKFQVEGGEAGKETQVTLVGLWRKGKTPCYMHRL
jgi:hypothetical protein